MKKKVFILLALTLFFICPFIVSAKSVTPNEVVENFKKGEIYKLYSAVDDLTWEVTYDESTKRIRNLYDYQPTSAGFGRSYYTDFYINYYENGNYIEYVATSNNKEDIMSENVYLSFILCSVGELFGYTTDEFSDLLNSDYIKDYTLKEDGIYMEYEDVKDYTWSDGTKVSARMIKKIQMRLDDNPYDSETDSEGDTIIPDEDINDPEDNNTIPEDEIDDDEIGDDEIDDDEFGDKEYDEFEGKDFDDEDSVENPSTSDSNIIFIIIAMIACIGIIIIGKNKLSKN